jgi:hypothetical protein
MATITRSIVPVIVASQQLGDLGVSPGGPTVVQWHWYHYLPGLQYLIFAAILLLLMVGRRAKARRAVIGLILIVAVAWWLL